jgi:hypothetical protein
MTYAMRLGACGVADERVIQLLPQHAKVFKYSRAKPQMKREALQKLNRRQMRAVSVFDTERPTIGVLSRFFRGRAYFERFYPSWVRRVKKCFRMRRPTNVGA